LANGCNAATRTGVTRSANPPHRAAPGSYEKLGERIRPRARQAVMLRCRMFARPSNFLAWSQK
jgi:hypothetical protein